MNPGARAGLFVSILLALALGIRLWGVGDRLPDPTLGINPRDDSAVEETDRTTMGRAWGMWEGGARGLDLNPHTAGWPALSFYLALIFQTLHRFQYAVWTGKWETDAFVAYAREHVDSFYLWMRLYSVGIGVLTVYLICRTAARILGVRWGLLAGLLGALSPLHIAASQHVADPNLLALLFTLLAGSALMDVRETARPGDSARAGMFIGLAAASKYLPLALLLPAAYEHARDRLGYRPSQLLSEPRFGLCIGAACVAFLVASPFLVLDWRQSVSDVAGQWVNLRSGWTGQDIHGMSLPAYLLRTLPDVLGWPGFLLGVGGLSLTLRAGGRGAVVARIPIVLVLAAGLLTGAQGRYVLPAVPFLQMGMVTSLRSFNAALQNRGVIQFLRRLVLTGGVLASCVVPLAPWFGFREALRLPDSRHVARRWIKRSVPIEVPMAMDLYGPVFNSDREERLALAWPFFASAPERVRATYHQAWLDGLRTYVVSDEVARRFEAGPASYVPERAFYRWIETRGTLIWDSRDSLCSGPRIRVYALPPGISSRATRDSIWSGSVSAVMDRARLVAWCADFSSLFLLAGNYDRSEEWALRGVSLAPVSASARLLGNLAFAELQLGKPVRAEGTASLGAGTYPNDARLHLYRGMALEALGDFREAIREYEVSLRLEPHQDGADHIREAIELLGLRTHTRYPRDAATR